MYARMTNAKLKIFHTDQRDIVETKSIGQTAKHLPIQESFISYGFSSARYKLNTSSFNLTEFKQCVIESSVLYLIQI